ncbi:MAG: hypothetical protein DWQ06_13620 [Calditrichaeota bacterium]|nr:MAG: hypothetical protein DWQ06_13620 [Calditrichota bacterium]
MSVIFKKRKKIKAIQLKVSPNVKLVFDRNKQIGENTLEACGILIGRHSEDGKEIRVELATPPSKFDVRKRFSFKIHSKHHQKILSDKFITSQNELVFLGTWHSHPEPKPTPSECDIKDWKKQFKKNKHLFDYMIFAIVGQKQIRYWLVKNGNYSRIKKKCVCYE